MDEDKQMISVVVPFYKGNRYMNELLLNLDSVAEEVQVCNKMRMEVIIVNDSPQITVEYTCHVSIPVTVVNNERNLGIHGSRIRGIRCARGAWIQMLDQDDLLVSENYPLQLMHLADYDVVVGNCLYYRGEKAELLYSNRKVMQYLLCQERFLRIRNLIASPGHCLIRKSAIPQYWLENPMSSNGSDDYYLWMIMFQRGAKFGLQSKPVYIHRNSEEGNLSFDLEKMQISNMEMCELLQAASCYPEKKLGMLQRSISFKYLFDTNKLRLRDWIRYCDKVLDNGIYKTVMWFLCLFERDEGDI